MELPVERLAGYGFSPALIAALKDSGISGLRGPQARALLSGELFSGEHLLIHLPTAAGKTLLGELCALSAVLAGRKALFAVPLKALAEEKYHEWKGRYGGYGLSVLCSTADHDRDDARLLRGDFDLAVVIYEKLRHLLSRAPRLFNQVGVVVWDEIQMLFDPHRGPLLELLLSHLSIQHPAVRLVGLSAVLDRPEELALYLGARLVQSEARPGALRKGILFQGCFEYLSEPDGEAGVEEWPELAGLDGPLHEQALAAALHLAGMGEPTLCFVSSRGEAQGLARQAASQRPKCPAERCLDELARLGDNQVGAALAETLLSGVAFHNADLTPEQRRLVEQGFRDGLIPLLVATSTLGMGVNLPVRNVVVVPFSWAGEAPGSPERRLLLPQEWNNRAGRAGRGVADFGRAILPAASPKEVDLYRRRFFESVPQRLPLHLSAAELDRSAPLLVLWGYATVEAMAGLLAGTPSGFARLRPPAELPDWPECVARALPRARQLGLARRRRDGRHVCTRLGRTVAELGLGMAEAERILEFWERCEATPGEGALLFFACRLAPARECLFPLEGAPGVRQGYVEELRDWLGEELAQSQPGLPERGRWEEAAELAAKEALALRDWMEGQPGAALEESYHASEGRLCELAETLAWLLEGCLQVGRVLGRNLEPQDALPARVRFGLPADLLALASWRAPGMGRAEFLRLYREGFRDPEALAAAPRETLCALLSPAVGAALFENLTPLRRQLAPSDEEHPAPDTLEVLGLRVGRQVAVNLNDRRVLLAPRSFGILVRLAWHRVRGAGWVERDRLGAPLEYVSQYLSQLRRQLAPYQAAGPGRSLVEADGSGRFRLRIASQAIRLNESRLAAEWPEFRLPVKA